MIRFNWKRLYACALSGALMGTSFTALVPVSCAWAQVSTLPDFADLVEQVSPSVVNIRTLEKVNAQPMQGPQMDEDMLEFFRRFGMPMPNTPRQAPPRNHPQKPRSEEQPRGVGSGFVLSADGFIMTNAHVVDGADEVLVTLTDNREFKAKIIGADKRSDVAVLKIDATGLPAVKVGDVSRLRVGEWVVAIGSPFGLENTVTAGIVSAKQRDTGEYLPFIQTDVAINPGNSGGPLINMRGEVVGINSQIYSRSGGSMGISFSIPMDEALRVSEQLRATGKVTRGRIGVQIDRVTKEVAESIGLGKAQGALVRAVEEGAPADKAGVEAGDIIVKFDGKAVEKSSDLPRMVGAVKPGTKSTLTVFRRGATKELTVVIVEIPSDKPVAKAPDKPVKPKGSAAAQALGLVVGELSDAKKAELRIKGGVTVESVADAAARAGLREGDVITQVGNTATPDLKTFESALVKLDKAKSVALLVYRDDMAQFVFVKPSR
ncbi:DegQ family serine endoprotease [Rhodoferax antarcticus]|uniref:Probable periplasmic serine endoprotease DegP-like n=1 Tax=Rhodoferax antarcticus ANT.BR TaxID=1111071 RepID=A0A1Q8YCT2_9BURK|nr:DegQ family serine endoprotease [Rhodoferax antarcticus]APW45781.1 serine peptidase [Rhodoferax antarcticus]OLP05858.1 protease Do family protein [Rhodoferax antarcticus ANT.BR]